MLSEVEKMMQKANVEKDWNPTPYGGIEEYYPPFTAEKQIELIKWLCKRGLLNVMYSEDKNTYHLFNDRCLGAFCYDIATAIATLVQCELDFCTLEEKQQVKEILE
jgi:hypothetical protein